MSNHIPKKNNCKEVTLKNKKAKIVNVLISLMEKIHRYNILIPYPNPIAPKIKERL